MAKPAGNCSKGGQDGMAHTDALQYWKDARSCSCGRPHLGKLQEPSRLASWWAVAALASSVSAHLHRQWIWGWGTGCSCWQLPASKAWQVSALAMPAVGGSQSPLCTVKNKQVASTGILRYVWDIGHALKLAVLH